MSLPMDVNAGRVRGFVRFPRPRRLPVKVKGGKSVKSTSTPYDAILLYYVFVILGLGLQADLCCSGRIANTHFKEPHTAI
jgi:hypothetical protein